VGDHQIHSIGGVGPDGSGSIIDHECAVGHFDLDVAHLGGDHVDRIDDRLAEGQVVAGRRGHDRNPERVAVRLGRIVVTASSYD